MSLVFFGMMFVLHLEKISGWNEPATLSLVAGFLFEKLMDRMSLYLKVNQLAWIYV